MEADGDGAERSGNGSTHDLSAPTWHQAVAPIVVNKCGGCHEDGGIAPFSLHEYAAAKPFASAIVEAVESGRMPPFLAQETEDCTPELPWADDLRLSEEEKQVLADWAAAGAPEGDAETAAPIEVPSPAQLPREDVVMQIPKEFVVEGDQDIHHCLIVDPGLEQDAYVEGRLITSGNEKILHHVVSYLINPGYNADGSEQTKAQLEEALRASKGAGIGESYECFGGPSLEGLDVDMLDAWAPGGTPNLAPEDSAQPIDKDALVLLDMHYHPVGAPETDSETKLSLMLTDTVPAWVSQTILIGNFEGHFESPYGIGELVKQPDEEAAEFLIPTDKAEHVEEMTWTWTLPDSAYGPVQFRVYAMGTHMHYVGRDMQVHLEHGERAETPGASECLVQTPAWDFNWQRGYEYDAPTEELPLMVDGDVLRMRCVFDNTMDNRFVRDALSDQGLDQTVPVPLGEDTLDEMCLAALGIMYPNPAAFAQQAAEETP